MARALKIEYPDVFITSHRGALSVKRTYKSFIKKHPELKDNIKGKLRLLQEKPRVPLLKKEDKQCV